MKKGTKIFFEFVLLFISVFCIVVFYLIFLLYGILMASRKWELLSYLRAVNVINDKTLNVTGKYALNQAMSHEPVFGNGLQTVSTAMFFARLHDFGKKWWNRIEKVEQEHFKKSFYSHKEVIQKEIELINKYEKLIS